MSLPFGLLFSEEDTDGIRAKAETAWGAGLAAKLREAAAELAASEPGEVGPGTAGPAGAAMVLAFSGLVFGAEEHLAAAKERALAVAGVDDWLAADVLRFGMTASSLALALDWGWEAYSRDEAARVLDALVGCAIENGDPDARINSDRSKGGEYALRGLYEYLDYESPHPFHKWAHSTNNWDVVIGAGLMLGWGAVERAVTKAGVELGATRDLGLDVRSRLDRWYDVAKQRLMNFTARCYSHAGQYCEGPDGYYTYGTENCLKGLEVARRLRGDDLYSVGLRLSPGWQRELYPWDLASGAQNLSDADLPGHPGPHVIARLAAESRSGWMQGFFIELAGMSSAGRGRGAQASALSLVWADESLEPEPYVEERRFFDFGDTGDVVMRTGRDAAEDMHAVFRCGRWNAAHTHMDRNSLVLSAFGERLLVDAGRMHSYGHEAHKKYHTRTVGHNCVLVGGLDDSGERGKAAGGGSGQHGYNDHPTWGRMLRSEEAGGGRYLVVGDASHCYVGAARALRAVLFDPGGFLVVWDLLEAPGVAEFWQLWRTDNRDGEARIDEVDGAIVLVRPGAKLLVVPALAPEAVERREGWIGSQEGGSAGACLKRADGRFLTVLAALASGEEPEFSSDGRGKASFTVRGEPHELALGGDAPGFVLDGREYDFSRQYDGLAGA